MKLYATTTSERASKGQGGNQRLQIDIFTGKDRKKLCWVNVEVDNIAIFSDRDIFVDNHGTMAKIEFIDARSPKGEQQKGECSDNFYSKTCKGCKFCQRELGQD